MEEGRVKWIMTQKGGVPKRVQLRKACYAPQPQPQSYPSPSSEQGSTTPVGVINMGCFRCEGKVRGRRSLVVRGASTIRGISTSAAATAINEPELLLLLLPTMLYNQLLGGGVYTQFPNPYMRRWCVWLLEGQVRSGGSTAASLATNIYTATFANYCRQQILEEGR